VLDNDELEHCETLAIPSSEIVVGAFIGRGACGDVMRGAWRGRSVAIKTLCAATCEPGTQESKDMIKEIALMCRSFSTVRHAAIVDFYGICTDGLQPWLIIEYVGGGSVESFMASQGPDYQPTRRQALTWALDLARGLEHLHAQRPAILHRDIKPGNLMVTDCLEHLKLCDFGVSTTLRINTSDRESAGAPAADGQCVADALYNDNDVIAPSARPKEMTGRTGTYRYMAPEVFHGETPHYNAAVDIYSASLSIWVLFHGKIPHVHLDGLTVAELALRQMLRPPLHAKRATMLPGAHKAMPSSISQLLVRAWHMDPAQRPSAPEMIAVLEEALKKESAGMLSSISSAMRGGIWHTQSNPGNLQYLGDHNSPPQRPTLRSLQCQSMKTLPKSTSLGNLQYLGDQSSPPQRPTLAMKTLPKSKSLDGIDQYGEDSTQPPKTHFTSSQTRSNREVRKQFIQQGYPRGSADEGEGEGKGGDAMRPSRAIAGMLSSISSAMRGSV